MSSGETDRKQVGGGRANDRGVSEGGKGGGEERLQRLRRTKIYLCMSAKGCSACTILARPRLPPHLVDQAGRKAEPGQPGLGAREIVRVEVAGKVVEQHPVRECDLHLEGDGEISIHSTYCLEVIEGNRACWSPGALGRRTDSVTRPGHGCGKTIDVSRREIGIASRPCARTRLRAAGNPSQGRALQAASHRF